VGRVAHAAAPCFLFHVQPYTENTMKLHESITFERLEEIIMNDEYIGFCVKCGAERECCEPDANHYQCDECGKLSVFGAEELLFHL